MLWRIKINLKRSSKNSLSQKIIIKINVHMPARDGSTRHRRAKRREAMVSTTGEQKYRGRLRDERESERNEWAIFSAKEAVVVRRLLPPMEDPTIEVEGRGSTDGSRATPMPTVSAGHARVNATDRYVGPCTMVESGTSNGHKASCAYGKGVGWARKSVPCPYPDSRNIFPTPA